MGWGRGWKELIVFFFRGGWNSIQHLPTEHKLDLFASGSKVLGGKWVLPYSADFFANQIWDIL